MLISVGGSQGSGKSTLLAELEKSYPVVRRKTSRSILEDWGVSLYEVNNNHDLTVKFQEEILTRKLNDEAAAVSSTEIHFTERSFIDLFVYSLVALGKDNQYSDWLDAYYTRCLEAQQTHNGVVYITAGWFTPENDGVRGHNSHYSRMVDLVMRDYIEEMVPPNYCLTVDTPNLSDRVAAVERLVDQIRQMHQ